MGRAVFFVAVMGLLPPSCAKMLGGSPDSPPQSDPPPVVPSTVPTAPPTFAPPDPPGPAATSAPPPGQSPEYVKAKEAAEKKDYKKVKAILGPRIKTVRVTTEEAQLLMDACANLKDKACMESVRKAHPEISM